MKQTNQYQRLLSARFYEACPKAVFAALAVSPIFNGGLPEISTSEPTPAEIEQALLEEWGRLHEQGIVPQRPPGRTGN